MKKKKVSMVELSESAGLQFDGGENETRMHFDKECINVFANVMSKKQYSKMEKEINDSVIKTREYTVYAWNDVSGYDYWKSQGECDDSNYIQVTVDIHVTPGRVNAIQLKKDVDSVFYKLQKYDNLEEYYSKKFA